MATETHTSSGMTKEVIVYVLLLILAAIVFVIGTRDISDSQKLLWMLIVACVEAAFALLFFMNLAANKGLRWFVLIFTIAVTLGLQYSWTDSFRELHGAPWSQAK